MVCEFNVLDVHFLHVVQEENELGDLVDDQFFFVRGSYYFILFDHFVFSSAKEKAYIQYFGILFDLCPVLVAILFDPKDHKCNIASSDNQKEEESTPFWQIEIFVRVETFRFDWLVG